MKRGEFLANKRKEKGLSVPDLAQMLNISEEDIELWEIGELPDSEHLLRLSSLLGVSVEDILRNGESEIDDDAFDVKESESNVDDKVQRFDSEQKNRSEEGARNSDVQQDTYCAELKNEGQVAAGIAEASASGRNGYFSFERKFGYIIFAVFVTIFIVSAAFSFIGWITRPRAISIENYKNYVEIDVRPVTSMNPEEYVVSVTAKTDISNFQITVQVNFHEFGVENIDFTETVTLKGDIDKNGTLTRNISLSTIVMERGYQVLSVSGGLA